MKSVGLKTAFDLGLAALAFDFFDDKITFTIGATGQFLHSFYPLLIIEENISP